MIMNRKFTTRMLTAVGMLAIAFIYGQDLPIPKIQSLGDPLHEIPQGYSGKLVFSSSSPVDFGTIFRGERGAETNVVGELRLPARVDGSRGKCPAMVILHGSGGISKYREEMYAQMLSENGIAAFVVDSYASRGVKNDTPQGISVLAVSEADMVADAYAALRVLQTSKEIDPERIGVLGFSYGGMAARFCVDDRIYKTLGSKCHPFALHIDFYGPTYMDLSTASTTGAPYMVFRGELDGSSRLEESTRIEEGVRRGGSSVGVRIFAKAGHGWELSIPQQYRETLSPAACHVLVRKNGDYEFGGQVFSSKIGESVLDKIRTRAKIVQMMSDLCMKEGYVIGRNEEALRSAKVELVETITSALRLQKRYETTHAIEGRHGMVVAPESLAAQAGLEVLRRGGNAIDAAVTIGFALAVTYPQAGNIGGGGFMLIRNAKSGRIYALDYREKAARKATADMFLDKEGVPYHRQSRFSYLSSGVPGTVRGLASALEQFGTISLEEALQPAIRLAKEGFPMPQSLSSLLSSGEIERRLHSSEARKVFYTENGEAIRPNQTLVQADLAWSLEQIAKNGPDAFYEGEIAWKIALDMEANGGLIDMVDLEDYQPVFRDPISFQYKNYDVFCMPPPSCGGVHIAQMFKMTQKLQSKYVVTSRAGEIHMLAEAMKRVYADRATYLGDPDFHTIPVDQLISNAYVEQRIAGFDPVKATPSSEIAPGELKVGHESNETTHFSVVDAAGNAVSNTYTLNFPFGSSKMARGTGILLNNEMDDFSLKPGEPDAFGLTGGMANSIEPGKRMLSSMSPTIVLQDGRVRLVTGSPGGSRIITTVFQLLRNCLGKGMHLKDATVEPRMHHQWLPDEISVERGMLIDVQEKQLKEMGYRMVDVDEMGSTNSIEILGDVMTGVPDPRGGGVALGLNEEPRASD